MKNIASIILAAGRGSRMKEFTGNKTLLPLIPVKSFYEGKRPFLVHILENLPKGPRAVILNYRKEEIIKATKSMNITYCEQPKLNGTGGALIAAGKFLESIDCEKVIITMGDVPFIKPETYRNMILHLSSNSMVVLGFAPKDKKQYGVLEIEGDCVKRIIEWKYWNAFPPDVQAKHQICNSGIYAAKIKDISKYISVLAKKPQIVKKEIDSKLIEIEEFFLTDLIEFMANDGLKVGFVICEHETEAMGVDDLQALKQAQEIYRRVTSNEQ
jgi:bifunctional UDP-N-acetylglucosamine pyrophosphorylase/glucosamine-1-phosphate N-acetyltransferase